jgi:hypothetical protein
VTASLQTRIQSLVGRGFTPEAAARAISRSDGEREAFIRFAFGVDWENPELYDLVLNMDKLPVGLAVRTVVDLARSKEIAEASVDALRSLEMMALRNRADAALIEAGLSIGRTASASVSVVKPGTLRLEGFVASQEEKREAETVLQSVRGVETIENALRVIPQVIVAGHTT